MALTLPEIIVLAIVQGITEFLPVSSSGHLVVVAALLAGGNTEHFDVTDVNIVLHGGTLLSILAFYWQRVWSLLREDRGLLGLLAAASLPAAMAGLGLELSGAKIVLSSPLLAGLMLPMTGLILLWAARRTHGTLTHQQLNYRRAVLIGICQAVAILPGISRSGTTIAAGLSSGLRPASAATFSFLLAIPVIGGGCLLEILKLARHGADSTSAASQTPVAYLACGAAIAFVVGLGSLWLLVRWLERGRFQYFAWWCIPVGIAVTAWQLLR